MNVRLRIKGYDLLVDEDGLLRAELEGSVDVKLMSGTGKPQVTVRLRGSNSCRALSSYVLGRSPGSGRVVYRDGNPLNVTLENILAGE
jgi:hypothetical protein